MAQNQGDLTLPLRGRRRSNAVSAPYSPVANPAASTAATAVASAAAFAEYSTFRNTLLERYSSPRIASTQPTSGALPYLPHHNMPDKNVPQPGPAKLTMTSGPDEWLQCALRNQYLPEFVMKKLCEICKEFLMEGEISHFHLLNSF